MSMIKDLAEFLEDEGFGTVGTDIFHNSMPNEPSEAICLYEYAGEPPLLRESLDRPGLQVAVRGTVYETTRATSQAIQNLLLRVGYELDDEYNDGLTINGTDYLRITPANGVQPSDMDDRNRGTIRQSYNILKRR